MNWMMKWLTVPASNETRQTPVVDAWEVRWCGGSWTSYMDEEQHFWDRREYVEVFVDQEQAESFAESLRNAFALVRATGWQRVTVSRYGA